MYKLAKDIDKENIKKLWAIAFNEQEPFLSGYFDGFWKAADAIMIDDGEKLIAALEMIPYDICVRNALLKSSYIVGVSVTPEERGKKYSKKLMQGCLFEQRKRSEAISLLIPFSYEFYRKLGYSLCYHMNVYETKTDNLAELSGTCDIKSATISNYQELEKAYEVFCADKHGYNKRTKHDWEYIFFEQDLFSGQIYASYGENGISGYVSYIKAKEKIYVRELVYNTCDALLTLLHFIGTLDTNGEPVIIRCADDNFLTSLLKEPLGKIKTMPTAMARIVDVCLALESVDLKGIKINVKDDLIEENNGTFEKINNYITKTDSCEFDVSVDIGALTQLFMGYYSAKDLAFLGKIKACEDVLSKLDKIFPKTKNYINHIMEP